MKPAYQIKIDNKDLAPKIKGLVQSLSVVDDVGFSTDSVTLTISDPDDNLAIPRTGVSMDVAMGYEDRLSSFGTYYIDEVSIGPGQITVSGKGFDTSEGIKSARSRSFKAKSVFEAVETIAKENGLDPLINKVFKDSLLSKKLVQRHESDLHLLTKLAKTYNAIFKIQGRKLLFSKKDSGGTVSGNAMMPILITNSDSIGWEARYTGRSAYKKVVAKFLSVDTGQYELVEVGDGKPVLELGVTFNDREKAIAEANSRLAGSGYQTKTLTLSMPGRMDIRSESVLEIKGFRSGIDGRWVVLRASHRIDGSYKLELECQKSINDEKTVEPQKS